MTQLVVEFKDENQTRKVEFLALSGEEKKLVYQVLSERSKQKLNFLNADEDFNVVNDAGQALTVAFSQMLGLRKNSHQRSETAKIRAEVIYNQKQIEEADKKAKIYLSHECIRVEQLSDPNANYTKDIIKKESKVTKIIAVLKDQCDKDKENLNQENYNNLMSEFKFAGRYFKKGVKLFFNPKSQPFGYVMSVVEGVSLYDYLTTNPTLTLAQRLDICIQIVDEFSAMHNEAKDEGFAHHDISANNIFYDAINNVITVIDFGNSEEKKEALKNIRNPIGTVPYSAPETLHAVGPDKILGKMPYPYDLLAIDRLAIGMLLLEVLTGTLITKMMDSFLSRNQLSFDRYLKKYEQAQRTNPNYLSYYEDKLFKNYKFIFGTEPTIFNNFFTYFLSAAKLDKDHASVCNDISNRLVISDPRERESLIKVGQILLRAKNKISPSYDAQEDRELVTDVVTLEI